MPIIQHFDDDIEGGAHGMAAVPIEKADVGASLPSSEEMKTSQEINKDSPCMVSNFWTCILFLVFTSIVVGLAVGISNKESHGPIMVHPHTDAVIAYLTGQGVVEEEVFGNADSPQFQAAAWLGELDKAEIPVPTDSKDEKEGYMYITRYVMALNYFSLGGKSWTDRLSFLSAKDVCEWNGVPAGSNVREGVFCDIQSGLPTYLVLSNNNLDGKIPKENGFLTTLEFIDLRRNNIGGIIPDTLCQLENARSLILSDNELTGGIPDCFGDLHKIDYLALSNNKLEGSLPLSLGNLAQMKRLFVDNNMFSGDPTNVFSLMTSLEVLIADNNEFEAEIDTEFLRYSDRLVWLDLSHNEFHSSLSRGLPAHLLALPSLKVLDLSNNKLMGFLPSFIEENTKLEFLGLSNNGFTGEIPADLKNLKNLQHLDLSINSFNGLIPEQLGEMENLELLFLSENPNVAEGEIPATFANLMNLKELSMRNTARSGELPLFIGTMQKLILLDLSGNNLTGTVPETYSQLTNLKFLLLKNNKNIGGIIPTVFSDLTALKAIFLDGTSLTGDLDLLCGLPSDEEKMIYADCSSGSVTCTCCTCCDPYVGCSDPMLANLDASWETTFQRVEYELSDEAVYLDGQK